MEKKAEEPAILKAYAQGVELSDIQLAALDRADVLSTEERSHKEKRRAVGIRRSIERACAARAEEAATLVRMEDHRQAAARQGMVLVDAGGFVRLHQDDGLLKLAEKGQLTPAEVKAAWAYRQLFVAEVSGGIRTSSTEGAMGGGASDAFVHSMVCYLDWYTVAEITGRVRNSAVGQDGLTVLEAVARHGYLLRWVTGGGKAWQTGLARLKSALAIAATTMNL